MDVVQIITDYILPKWTRILTHSAFSEVLPAKMTIEVSPVLEMQDNDVVSFTKDKATLRFQKEH